MTGDMRKEAVTRAAASTMNVRAPLGSGGSLKVAQNDLNILKSSPCQSPLDEPLSLLSLENVTISGLLERK